MRTDRTPEDGGTEMAVTSTSTVGDASPADGSGEAPLAGLRVVEISMYVQGPVAGLVLASLGSIGLSLTSPIWKAVRAQEAERLSHNSE